MNPFEEACGIEDQAMAVLIPFIQRTCPGLQIVPTKHQELLQKVKGDLLTSAPRDRWIEIKAELANKTGNLFLETWSNRARGNPGWMDTCFADRLWYYFIQDDELFTMRMADLRLWAFGPNANILNYPEKQQSKYCQLNDTWGRCVPIAVLANEVHTFKGPTRANP